MGQVLPADRLAEVCAEARRDGSRVVFTNGCFDLLHPGHVSCLSQAKAHGDILVVGLNSDGSVRRLKGPGRPYMTQKDRALLLCSLASVDYVCVFEEDTPQRLIEMLGPDVLVKGRDYEGKEVVGAEEVRRRGGSVVLVEVLPGYSTTALAERIASVHRRPGER